MPLITCPACGHRISVEAEACPECGHPNRLMKSAGPTCYACSAPATTRCERCDAFSCALHVQSGSLGKGRALLCKSCKEWADKQRTIAWIIAGVFIAVIIIIAFAHH